MSNSNQANKALDDLLSMLPSEMREEVRKRIQGVINYTPRVGIMGKSGAGKSSLINGLVGKNVCETGGVGGCTRDKKDISVKVGNNEIIFTDFPGVAENAARNKEYSQMYSNNLKDLDIILWVIKVDDRANSNDESFYKWLTQYYKKEQILFVLSQCDKAEPSRDFNYEEFNPSDRQLSIINQNQLRLAKDFDVSPNSVIPVACDFYNGKFDRYNFDYLVNRIIQQVPAESKSSLLKNLDKDNRTKESEETAKDSFGDVVDGIVDIIIDYSPMPPLVKTVAKAAKKKVVEYAKKIWGYFFD